MQEVKTITGSLVQRNWQSKSTPADSQENKQKLGFLLRLGSHYWPNDFTPAQANEFLADYIEDLDETPVADLEIVCRAWRRNAANKRFPRSGELLLALQRERPMKVDNLRPAPFSDRPILWHFLPKELWDPTWREEDVPADHRAARCQ